MVRSPELHCFCVASRVIAGGLPRHRGRSSREAAQASRFDDVASQVILRAVAVVAVVCQACGLGWTRYGLKLGRTAVATVSENHVLFGETHRRIGSV